MVPPEITTKVSDEPTGGGEDRSLPARFVLERFVPGSQGWVLGCRVGMRKKRGRGTRVCGLGGQRQKVWQGGDGGSGGGGGGNVYRRPRTMHIYDVLHKGEGSVSLISGLADEA